MRQKFNRKFIEAGLRTLGLDSSPSVLERFQRYHCLLLDWNARVNLISRSDESRIEYRHFFDSLVFPIFFPSLFLSGQKIMDIGSGAGFPGIPLGIIFSECSFYLVEATKKRSRFLSLTVSELGLENVQVVPHRAEVWGKNLEDHVDLIVARAVSSMQKVVKYGFDSLRIGGSFLVLRGMDTADRAVMKRGLKIKNIYVDKILHVPETEYYRGSTIVHLVKKYEGQDERE